MTYDEALKYIHSVTWRGSKLGLDRTRELLSKLGNPEKKLRFIHIAGTNGKGSVSAMLASVLREAGYKTGLYTSPYILEFNERMQINGVSISNDELAELTGYVAAFADTMSDPPTEFELITAIAFEYFMRNGCDIVVLETGMGANWIPPMSLIRQNSP
jgi:dihydrofolate synthase/folylpolyglutamate synthase